MVLGAYQVLKSEKNSYHAQVTLYNLTKDAVSQELPGLYPACIFGDNSFY